MTPRFSICDRGHDRQYVQVVDGHQRRIDGTGRSLKARGPRPAEDDLSPGVYCEGCIAWDRARGAPILPLDTEAIRLELGELLDQRRATTGHVDLKPIIDHVLLRHDVVAWQHSDELTVDPVLLPSCFDSPAYVALRDRFPEGLYPTQLSALEGFRCGDDVVQVTPTASGKSIGLLVPAIDRAAEGTNVLVVTPRNVLPVQYLDELKTIFGDFEELDKDITEFKVGDATVVVGVLNGDNGSPVRKSADVRKDMYAKAHVLITNDYMFETELMAYAVQRPKTGVTKDRAWRGFLENTSLIVFDELDCKLGHDRSITMWALRSMVEYITQLGSRPQVLMASATIGDPARFHSLFAGAGAPLHIVDGATRTHPRDVVVLRPELDSSMFDAAVDAVVDLARANDGELPMTAVFVASPRQAEILAAQLKDALKAAGFADQASLVAKYTGPTDEDERREIEDGIRRYQTRVTIATEAFGIGTDLGALQVCLMVGLPPSAGKAMQWIGRVGRRSPSLSVIVLDDSPLARLVAETTHPHDALRESAREEPLAVASDHIEMFLIRPLIGTLGVIDVDALGWLPTGFIEELVAADPRYELDAGKLVAVSDRESSTLFTHNVSYVARTYNGKEFRLSTLAGAAACVRGAELLHDGQLYRVERTKSSNNNGNTEWVLHVHEIDESNGWGCRFDYEVDDQVVRNTAKANGLKAKYSSGAVRLKFVSSGSRPRDLPYKDAGIVELSLPQGLSRVGTLSDLVLSIMSELAIPLWDVHFREVDSTRAIIVDTHASGRTSWQIADELMSRIPHSLRSGRKAA